MTSVLTKPNTFVAKRGRPTTSRLAAIERNILSVACAMFLEQGYANTSMDAVASAASVSKSTLYSRYADKSQLFDAVVTDRLAEWDKTGISASLSQSGSIPDFLFRFAVSFLRSLRIPEIAAFHRLLNAESERFPHLAGEFYRRGYDRTVSLAADELARLANATGWHIVDGRGLIVAFNSALLGWYHSEALVKSLTDDDCATFASRLVAVFVGGRTAW